MYSEQERAQLTIQYEPLINKLTAQFFRKVDYGWDDIKSMAYEGFALALVKYDPSRSNMSFMSFAAFEMRNNIMTRLTEETRTVRIPYEEFKRRQETGQTGFTSISIDKYTRDSDDENGGNHELKLGTVTEAKFSDGDVFDYMYQRLEDKFPARECEMFYMSFGLREYEETPNKDIAKMFNVSEGLISQKKKKIIDFIRQDGELCEMLTNLLTK